MQAAELPLAGLLVLDFSQFLAGPVAALRLADLGARVIKVERPGTGEIGRTLAFAGRWADEDTVSFHAMNRNKEAVVADLKDPRDLEQVKRLVARADVLIHNFRPGVMERLGLDYDAVRELNPGLVYAAASGYGAEGPWAGRPGQDLLAQSVSGLAWTNGADRPVTVGLSLADHLLSCHIAEGVTALLVRKARTGRGGLVESSLLEAVLDLQSERLTARLNPQTPQPPDSADVPGIYRSAEPPRAAEVPTTYRTTEPPGPAVDSGSCRTAEPSRPADVPGIDRTAEPSRPSVDPGIYRTGEPPRPVDVPGIDRTAELPGPAVDPGIRRTAGPSRPADVPGFLGAVEPLRPAVVPGIYRTADGYLAIAAGGEDLEDPERLEDFGGLRDLEGLGDRLRTASTDYWVEVLGACGVECAPLQTLGELLTSPEFAAIEMTQTVERPPVVAGDAPLRLLTTRSPIRIDGEALRSHRAAPRLGAQGHVGAAGVGGECGG